VRRPEQGGQVAEPDQLRIEVELQGFGVVLHVAVGRGKGGPAGVADPSSDDPWEMPELGIRSPESTQ
jgi:hypothetical protein